MAGGGSPNDDSSDDDEKKTPKPDPSAKDNAESLSVPSKIWQKEEKQKEIQGEKEE